ncbi:hypothetical protein HDU80_000898, partial [Chytriomyces hyalinus]
MSPSGWTSVKTNQHTITPGNNELEILIATPMVSVNACPKVTNMMDSLEDSLLKKFFKEVHVDPTRGVKATIWAVWAKAHQKLKLAPFVNQEFLPPWHTNSQTPPTQVQAQLPLFAEVQDMLKNELQQHNLPVPLFGGLFTSMAINWTAETAFHVDVGDYPQAWTLVIPLGKFE